MTYINLAGGRLISRSYPNRERIGLNAEQQAFTGKLRAARMILGWTQDDLAARARVSRRTLIRAEAATVAALP